MRVKEWGHQKLLCCNTTNFLIQPVTAIPVPGGKLIPVRGLATLPDVPISQRLLPDERQNLQLKSDGLQDNARQLSKSDGTDDNDSADDCGADCCCGATATTDWRLEAGFGCCSTTLLLWSDLCKLAMAIFCSSKLAGTLASIASKPGMLSRLWRNWIVKKINHALQSPSKDPWPRRKNFSCHCHWLWKADLISTLGDCPVSLHCSSTLLLWQCPGWIKHLLP